MRLHDLLTLALFLFAVSFFSGCNRNGDANEVPTVTAPTVAATTDDAPDVGPGSADSTSVDSDNVDSDSNDTGNTDSVTTAVEMTATLTTTRTPSVSASAAVSEPITATAGNTETAAASATARISATAGATETVESSTLVATATQVLVPTNIPAVQAGVAVTDSATQSATISAAANQEDVAPGTVRNVQFVERVTAATIAQNSQFFYPADNLVEATYDVDIYRLEVQSTTETGEPIDLQTDVYVPRVDAPMQFPILGYAPGTTGLGDGCAPSQEIVLGRGWGSYYIHMLSYAGQGYIGVLPDGMSYDDPQRPHEYFIAELEAHTLLDAVRGARNFLAETEEAAQPLDAIFLGGYSNGGHTAFAAKDFAAEYAPELPIRGVISHGATTNVETLMRESPVFTPYLIYAYQFYYGDAVITPQQVFTQNWLPTFTQDVATKCVDEIFVYYSNDPVAMYNTGFRSALQNGELADNFPLFKTVLDANYAGTFGGFEIPVVFFQGTADSTVTPRAQQQFAQDLCAQEQPVTYVALPTVRHVDTRQRSFLATLDWMQSILDGEAPENSCGALAEE